MSFKATVNAGWTYTTGNTATASNLNALGIPEVIIPDDQTYLANVGSLATPGIAFNGDANTGLAQLGGADTVSIVTGGVETVRFINDQVLATPGADGTPAYSFIGDTNTGINRDAADELDIVCGGSVVGLFYSGGVNIYGTLNATSITMLNTPVLTAGINPNNFVYYTDFMGKVSTTAFKETVVATGAVKDSVNDVTINDQFEGIVSLEVSAVSDVARIHFPFEFAVGGYVRARVRVGQTTTTNALSTGSERYAFWFGLTTGNPASASNYIVFSYTDSAAAQWEAKTKYVSTETTTTDVNVSATLSTWYKLEIRRTAADTYVFYINDVIKATHALISNILSGVTLNAEFGIEKSIGSSMRGVAIDSFELYNPLTRL